MAIKTRTISFVWGVAEATFFFLVPDIWLSRIALTDKKEALINIGFATLGALLGGSILYFLALEYFENIQNFLGFIPGISSAMIEQTGNQVQEQGLGEALLTGIASGIPYKIYAAWSGHLGLSLGVFLLASAFIRALRFTLVTGMAYVASLPLKRRLNTAWLHSLHAICWITFYIFYFYRFGI